MSSCSWQIVERIARLKTDVLTASIDADNPAAGLRIETLCDRALAGASLFGVQIEPSICLNDPAPAAPQVDCFVRGHDFVATYAETADRPFRAQIYWRLIDSDVLRGQQFGNDRAAPIVALELIVSVQTSRLGSETGLSVCTTLGNVETWRLLDAAEDRLASESNLPHRDISRGGAQSDAAIVPESHASDSPGCCLIRPVGSGSSYLEMVHPADFRQTNFEWIADAAPVVRLSHRLFAERLEKGVILRSRIRGLFVPRNHDIELARSEYHRFAASEPPLTT